jgi:hypothetical protein
LRVKFGGNQLLANGVSVAEQAQTGVVLLVVLLLTYILRFFSDAILRITAVREPPFLSVVMRIILASLAVENRTDDIGSGKLGTRFALELRCPIFIRLFAHRPILQAQFETDHANGRTQDKCQIRCSAHKEFPGFRDGPARPFLITRHDE